MKSKGKPECFMDPDLHEVAAGLTVEQLRALGAIFHRWSEQCFRVADIQEICPIESTLEPHRRRVN